MTRAKVLVVFVGDAGTFYKGDNSHGHINDFLQVCDREDSLVDHELKPLKLAEICQSLGDGGRSIAPEKSVVKKAGFQTRKQAPDDPGHCFLPTM